MLRLALMVIVTLGAIWMVMVSAPPGRQRVAPPPAQEPAPLVVTEPSATRPVAAPDNPSASELAPDAGDSAQAASGSRMPGPALRPSPQYPDTIAPGDAPAPQAEAGGEAAPAGQRQVTANRVNLRAGPGTDHAVIGAVTGGERVTPLAPEAAGWQQVRTDDGTEGWLATQFLSAPLP